MNPEKRPLQVDLDWDDAYVITGVHHLDTTFLFARMTQGTHDMVAPRKGERILDVGCGKAADALQLATSGGHVIGLDPSGKMLRQARDGSKGCGTEVALVRGIGEALPFRRGSLDKVVCKGALDHFPDPQRSIEEMSLVLKPEGEAIIAIANFESLSCRVGRAWHSLLKKFVKGDHPRTPWEIPEDHTCKLDYPLIISLVQRHFEVKKVLPISLLWTAPYWGKAISLPPRRFSQAVLSFLDAVARRVPALSDVVIVKGTPRRDQSLR